MVLLPNLCQHVPHALTLVAPQEWQDLLPEGGGRGGNARVGGEEGVDGCAVRGENLGERVWVGVGEGRCISALC